MAGKTKKPKDRKASSEKGTKKAAKKMTKERKGSKIEYFNKFPFCRMIGSELLTC
jgi:hypothetical protein